ncbi:MAG: TlpA disulfide reductase family protein [Acidimicrobiales bacterium]|nr:TlpA disulfide reductase family protein [Acidimicrobiales bacterium]
MRRRLGPWLAGGVLLVVLGLVVTLATSDPSTQRVTASPLIGRQAPDISADRLAGGRFELSAQRGRFVVVNFFATWCIPCIREHPELVEFSRSQGTGGAAVVSVVYDDDPDDVQAFFDENGGDWPVVLDTDGRVALSYGVSGVPESYLVAPDGTVVTKLIGGVTADDLDQVLSDARALIG